MFSDQQGSSKLTNKFPGSMFETISQEIQSLIHYNEKNIETHKIERQAKTSNYILEGCPVQYDEEIPYEDRRVIPKISKTSNNVKKRKRIRSKLTDSEPNKNGKQNGQSEIKNIPKIFGNYFKYQSDISLRSQQFHTQIPKDHHKKQTPYSLNNIKENLICGEEESRAFFKDFLIYALYPYLIQNHKIKDARSYIKYIQVLISGCNDPQNFKCMKQTLI